VVDGKKGVCTINNGALQCEDAKATGTGALATGTGASANGAGTVAEGLNASAKYAGSVAIGDGAQANADPTTAIGNNAIANGNNSTAIGANSTANGENSVALGQGSVANRADSVSVGDAATGLTRQITNVAPGTATDDAVNVGQLHSGMNQVYGAAIGKAQRYADNVGAVDAAAAGAAAEAAAGQGVNSIAGGASDYNGQSAFAFTYQRRFNHNWAAAVTVGSNGSSRNTSLTGAADYSW